MRMVRVRQRLGVCTEERDECRRLDKSVEVLRWGSGEEVGWSVERGRRKDVPVVRLLRTAQRSVPLGGMIGRKGRTMSSIVAGVAVEVCRVYSKTDDPEVEVVHR